MKILLLSTLYPPHAIGGAEKAAALLAEAMVRQGHTVTVVSLHPESGETVEDQDGIRVYRLPLDNLFWPFGRKRKVVAPLRLLWHILDIWNRKAARRVGKILDAERPDVVHTHNISGFSLSVWREVRKRHIRLVHTVHDYYLLCSRSSLFRRGRNCEQRCLSCRMLTFNRRALSALPDSVVSVSRFTLDTHLKYGCFQHTHRAVIPNIYRRDHPVLQRPPAGPEPRSGNVVFGFIGRLEQAKGIETLLTATGRLRQSNWQLRIAGVGLDAYVHALMRRFTSPRIQWLGFTDPARFFAEVDVVVIPSIWADPLPYVGVESLHAGKPLLCASSGGIPEIARLSSQAHFYQPGDAAALAELMDAAMMRPSHVRKLAPVDDQKLSIFTEAYVTRAYLAEYFPRDAPG